MDRFAEKQAQIARQRQALITRYPTLWDTLLAEWLSPGPDDRCWLTYAANYLFRTGPVRWALDPLTLGWRLGDEAPRVDIAPLERLSFVLLTHRHKDHLDLELLHALRHSDIRWVVPEAILPEVIGCAGLKPKNILVPQPLQPIELEGMRITPLEGQHWEIIPGANPKGLPAMAYRVEFGGKRWLFPGDTRTYDNALWNDFSPLDGLFAHLWLGRGCALWEQPPLLEAFCRFHLAPQPRTIILAHLHEFGRDAHDWWDESHAAWAAATFHAMRPGLAVTTARIGESVRL